MPERRRQDRKFTAQQKSELVLASLRGPKSIAELFYEFERLESPTPSKLLSQPMRFPAPGIGVRRLDHVNVTAADVDATRDWPQRCWASSCARRRAPLRATSAYGCGHLPGP